MPPATIALKESISKIGEVKIAHFAGPCDFESQYAGPFFYATHVAEIAIKLLDDTVTSLKATRSGKNVAVQLVWKRGVLTSFSYLGDAAYVFHANLFGTDGMLSQEIIGGYSSYAEGLKSMLLMIETKSRPLSNEQLLHPIAIVHAIQKSLENGGTEVKISEVLVT